MAQAKRDENGKPMTMGVSKTDGNTPISMVVDPITLAVLANQQGDALTVTVATIDKHDQNDVPTVYGVSSADGKTLIPIATDNNGRILAQTT